MGHAWLTKPLINACVCKIQMVDMSEIARRHCEHYGLKRNLRVLFCGDHFDDEGEFQMQQGLGPALNRAPVAKTCYWVGKIVSDVDITGKNRRVDVCIHVY